MLASISVILGILLSVAVLAVVRRRGRAPADAASLSTSLGWIALTLGVIAVIALIAGLALSPQSGNAGFVFNLLSMLLGSAAVVIGIGSLRRGDRRWPTWVGLIAGLLPSLFWLAFAAGHVLGPGD